MNMKKWHLKGLAATLAAVFLLAALVGCTGASTTTSSTTTTPTGTGPIGGTIIRSDSIVTAEITSPERDVNGVEIDVRVISTQNVEDLPNPVADKVNQVVTVRIDGDISSFRVGDKITGHIKYSGDVEHGIFLQMSDITKAYTY